MDVDDSEAGLAEIVKRIGALLSQTEVEMRRAGPGREEQVLQKQRDHISSVMNELGDWLAHLRYTDDTGAHFARVRAALAQQLQLWSVSSPFFAQLHDLAQGQRSIHDLTRTVAASRTAGASISAMVFHDYFLHTRSVQAGRNRLVLLTEMLERKVRERVTAGCALVDILCLEYIGGVELEGVLRNPDLANALNLTCLDSTTEGSRHAHRSFTAQNLTRARVERSDAFAFLEAPSCQPDSHDIVYAANLLDVLSQAEAQRLVRDVAHVLRSGGVFIALNNTHDYPIAEQMVRSLLLNWEWTHRDEDDWKRLFRQTAFAEDKVTLLREPLGISLLAAAVRR